MTTSEICIMIAIVVYLVGMLSIGIVFSKKTKNVGDFYLGGRKLGPLVTAMSAEASDMSGWLLMGLPGLALLCGTAEPVWTAIGLAVGTYINWLVVAKKLRNYSAKIGAITIPDYFSKRYNENRKILMAVAAVIIIVFFVPYTASGFSACGKLFSTLFGIQDKTFLFGTLSGYHLTMIISAIIIVGYTSLGGFNAASTTDLIQSIIMTIALVIVLVFGISQAGGIGAVIDNAKSLNDYLSLTSCLGSKDADGNEILTIAQFLSGKQPVGGYSLLTIISTLAWGLGYFGMPHILLRFMAIKNPDKIKTSRRIATIWVVISMGVAVAIGVVGRAMMKNGAIEPLITASSSESIIIQIAKLLADKGIIFALIAGVILAGILASTMSTADSQLLAASSSASENIIGGLFKVKLTEKKKMLVARAVLVVMSVVGVIIAWNPDSSVFRIVSFAWAGFGAAFGPVVLLSLFWKRSNKYGAFFGMLAGGGMVFLWKFVISKLGGVFAIYELLPAFIVGLVVNILVSLVTPAPEQEIVDTFDKLKKNK